jgi:rare lipoprotein A (peptidoglycan hydrolase)
VPIAQAATAGETGATNGTGAQLSPVVQDAAFRPAITGRMVDRNSFGHDGVHARAVVTNAGSGSALVTLRVRRAGRTAWKKALATRVKPGKKFTLSWRGQRPGRYLTKITVSKYGKQASDHLGAVYVYRKSFASWYGPGLYGGGLACGGRLTPSTIGVAHKTLPCGTKVTFHSGGHTVTARVVDRGPYVSGRDWDLTAGLKRKLHFGGTGSVHSTS